MVRGGNITLHCEADGVPRPVITWLKDGRPLGTGSGLQILSDGRLLRIRDAQVVHTGRYTCIAVNVAGQDESKHDVTVHGVCLWSEIHVQPHLVDVYYLYHLTYKSDAKSIK